MEKNIGRIWFSLAILAIATIIWVNGESLRMIQTKQGNAPFLVALTQLGILYIVALFVERSLEALIKVWRPGEKITLEEGVRSENDAESETEKEKSQERYKAGTQHRALLTAFTLGLLVSLGGSGCSGPFLRFREARFGDFK